MYACICARVTDRAVERLARKGCRSVEQVAERCGAGASCGTCREDIQRLIDETRGDLVATGRGTERAW